MKPRRRVVQNLVDAAVEALSGESRVDRTITVNEVLMAELNIARQGVIVARDAGASIPALRNSVQKILLECYDPKERH